MCQVYTILRISHPVSSVVTLSNRTQKETASTSPSRNPILLRKSTYAGFDRRAGRTSRKMSDWYRQPNRAIRKHKENDLGSQPQLNSFTKKATPPRCTDVQQSMSSRRISAVTLLSIKAKYQAIKQSLDGRLQLYRKGPDATTTLLLWLWQSGCSWDFTTSLFSKVLCGTTGMPVTERLENTLA